MCKGKLIPPPSRCALLCGAILLGTIQAAQAQIAPDDSHSVGAPTHRFTISPAASAVQLRGQVHYSLSTAEAVTWEVNGIAGGTAATGTITPAGVYTAPATLPHPFRLVITARLTDDPQHPESALVSLASGTAYYVSQTGNDSNAGTMSAPWRTIQHAATTVKAGDTVNIRAGVYNEAVTPTGSGSASAASITFQSYPGELAVIDGTGLKVVNGQSGLFNISGHDYITVSGLEIRNFTSSSDSQVPVGIYVSGADNFIQLLSNHVHNITTTAPANANNCASDALGIAIYGTTAPASINNLVISGNEVDHNKTGCSETVTLNGNVENFTVTGNLIHDNNNIGIDAIGFEKTSPQTAYDQARNGVISGNTVYNITSYGNPDYGNVYAADGIYVDGGTNILIERNTVHNADLNVELASEHSGKLTSYITLRNNLIYAGNSNGISIGGYDSKRGGTDHCTIVNNTLYNNDTQQTGSGEFQVQYYATNNVFKDNIIYAGAQDLFFNSYASSESNPVDVDYNLYYSTDAADAQWIWNAKNSTTVTTYTGFAKYQSGTGKDPDSHFANPQFLSLSTPNLDVSSTSPAVGTGVVLGAGVNGTVDFAGNPRTVNGQINIGAYEE
jgi:Right handed beta helix region